MLKLYKNGLLTAIREAGFDPKAFEAKETSVTANLPSDGTGTTFRMDLPVFWIAYHDHEPYFTIRSHPEDSHVFNYAYTKFAPTYPRVPTSLRQFFPARWIPFSEVMPAFQGWLTDEVSQAVEDDSHPDLWAQLSSQESLATDLVSARPDETMFSIEEQAQIQIALREFQLLVVKTFNPGERELQVIHERLDYLGSAVGRLNRFDWRGTAIQTVLGIGTALTLSTEQGRILWGLFQQVMSTVQHLLP